MATEVVETIGSGGDFSDISSWVSALPSDLTSQDEVRIGRLIDASDYSEASTITISNITTDATRYVQLEAASDVRHNGTGDASGARYAYTGGGHAFQVDIDHFRVRWIDFSYPSGGGTSDEMFRWNGAGEFRVEFCLGHDIPHHEGDFLYPDADTATREIRIQNCLFWTIGRGALHNQGEENVTWYIYNVTAWDIDVNSGGDANDPYGAIGFSGSPNTGSVMVCKNVYADTGTNTNQTGGPDGDAFFDREANGDFTGSEHNISSDTTAPGTNSQTEVSPSGEFLSLSGTIDLHIVSGETLEHAGTDLSSDSNYAITDDIDGQTRSGTWDVGADQTVNTENTYSTDFGEYTTGQQPNDWTARQGTPSDMYSVEDDSGASGGKVLHIETSTSFTSPAYLTWDDIDSDAERQDAEILTKVQFLSNEDALHLLVRGGDGPDGYLLHVNPASDDIRIEKFVGGSFTSDLASTAMTIDTDTWYWARFRVNGSDLMGRVWQDGNSEPSTWDVTTTDTDITSDGWVGFNYFDQDQLAVIEADVFGVGTGGATAEVAETFSESITDSSQATDLSAGALLVDEALSDLAEGLDTAGSSTQALESISDLADALETLNETLSASVVLSDQADATELTENNATAVEVLLDGAQGTDALVHLLVVAKTLAASAQSSDVLEDAGAVIEQITGLSNASEILNNTIVTSESLSALVEALDVLADNITTIEIVSDVADASDISSVRVFGSSSGTVRIIFS